MNLLRKQIAYKSINEIFEKYIVDDQVVSQDNLFFLYELVRYFRPKRPKTVANITLRPLLDHLIEFDKHRNILSNYLKNILSDRKFHLMVSDAGILQDSDFLYEVRKRISAKILPYQPQKDTLEYVLNQVFYKENDFIWINKIPLEELVELMEVLNGSDIYQFEKAESGALSEILFSMGLLTQRMSGRSMDTSILKMIPKYNHLESPFLGFENEFLEIENRLRKGEIQFVDSNDLNYKQLVILYNQCVELIKHAYKNSSVFGITLKVNQSLLRIRQQLDRIKILIDFLVVDKTQDRLTNTIKLSLKLIEYNCYKNNISKLIAESTQVVSYEITQYTAKTGEHYITETAKEYFSMFKASLGAGLVVGFLCIFKVLLSKVTTSDFGFAFLYSMNYAFGFIVIYLCGFALATKQPAMTAATIIKAIEEGRKNQSATEQHSAFATLFARLFRSQFIAFVGNVIMAFAVGLLLIWLIDTVTGINIADTKWPTMIKDSSPVHSLAIFHAGIAGVFLFLSGIISGNVSNKNKHNQVYYRIQENPVFKSTFGTYKTAKIASWLERKWSGIVSNFWFGVFMGSTHSIGIFLGLNLDIRHITFVSGNIALGAYGADFQLPAITWFWCFMGIFLVGFMNFIVSFGLSLSLALRSRNIPLIEIFSLQKSVWKHFKKRPLHFFFPPGKQQR
ncbi:recombinase [Flavobacterium dauae]|uniref:recombinase n=1 Tax=Flavobacterium dauae TaxID=1563479 RepID=UPI00101B3E71|nr:recombinase [Flavobacterium dauae]WLD23896.1 recombinase [Flavobacterium dauae]